MENQYFWMQKSEINTKIIKKALRLALKVEGESMKEAGINNGDVLIVDRAEEVRNRKIVVAILNGEFTVKRILIKGEKLYLAPENANFSPIQITDAMDFEVWGVVTYVIHKAV